MKLKWHVIVVFACATCAHAAKQQDWYWRLGAGLYAGIPLGSPSDEARWDWVDLNFGNMGATTETLDRVNRNLKLNPRQKYLGQLCPINNLGKAERYSSTATMFDYRYGAGVKEALEKELRREVRILLDNISKPENVVGFTFLEEVPGWWGAGNQIAWGPAGKIPPILEEFRSAIEKERGKPLVWDDETRLWVGKVYVETISRMHKIIKEEAPGKLVFYWLHSGYSSLDDVGYLLPAETPLQAPGLYPYHITEIIKPGLCDGIMAYPNNPEIWEKKYMRHVRKYGWLFFSQLSHPGNMRLQGWKESIEMVKTKMPQNLGYFFFCSGGCAAPRQWNEDPTVPNTLEENISMTSVPRHIRRFCAQEKIGEDVLARSLNLRLQVDAPLKDAKPGAILHIVALVQNPKELCYYANLDEAIARGVKASIELPKGFQLDQRYTAPATLSLGDLKPLERKAADWWVTVQKTVATKAPSIKVSVTSSNTASSQAVVTEDVAIPAFQPDEILESGESWMESGYRSGQASRPAIVMEGLSTPVKNPSLSDGVNVLTYKGELAVGLKVVITPDGKARLYATNLVDQPIEGLADSTDPSGFKAFSEGYGIAGQSLGKYIKGGTKYRVTISGKAEGGANSQVFLRCLTQEGKVWETGMLWNSFSDQWKDNVSGEVEIPAGVNFLERLYLYRANSKGRVWYGQVSIQRADIPAEGLDVSAMLSGQHPVIQPGTFTIISYRDEDPPASAPKVRVQLQPKS